MILAAADHAGDPRKPAPVELEYVFDHRMWGALPEAGGLRDQPAGLLKRMRAAWATYQAIQVYERGGRQAGAMAKWRRENPEAWEVVQQVQMIRESQLNEALEK